MYMTHYMELLSTTTNLLIFMALPVVLAETAAITELVILFSKGTSKKVRLINKASCYLCAIVFIFIDLYILREVIMPLSANSGWYGLVDKIAVIAFLLGGVIMIILGIFTMNAFAGIYGERGQKGIRIGLLAAFLVVSHIAMIAGMADPRIDPDYRAMTEVKPIFSQSVKDASRASGNQHMHNHNH